MAAGGSAPAREARELGLGPCGGSESNTSAVLCVVRVVPQRG